MKNYFRRYIFLFFCVIQLTVTGANRLIKSADTTLVFIPDDPILAMMDSLNRIVRDKHQSCVGRFYQPVSACNG